MNEIAENFNNNEQELKKFVGTLEEYNSILEGVYVKMIEEIKSNFLGKKITRVFANKIESLFKGVCLVSVRNDYFFDDRKEISVCVVDKTFRYDNTIKNAVSSNISCVCGETCTNDNKFDERTIEKVVETINLNRYRVAKYKDALKNFKKHKKILEKAAADFIAKMESINPLFVDYTTTGDMYCISSKTHFDYTKYENIIKADLPTFTLDD